jgi:hypothetical protein
MYDHKRPGGVPSNAFEEQNHRKTLDGPDTDMKTLLTVCE